MADELLARTIVLFASILVGFGPAVSVLFHALRTYDYPFTDKAYFETRRVFTALAVGMVLGTISGGLTVGLRAGILTLLSLVILLLLLALFEEGFKLVYLNRKGYRGRFDTTYVGLTLGVGIAAIVGAGSAYGNGPALVAPTSIVLLAAFAASLGFVHASTGALIGFGCSKGEVLVPFAQAYVARILHAAMLVPFFVAGTVPAEGIAVPLFSLLVAVAFAVVLYAYVYRTVLPGTLPPELRRERRRRVRTPDTVKE